MDQQSPRPPGWNWWYLLLLVQILAVLWPPFYNKVEPDLDRLALFLLVSAPMGHHRNRSYRNRLIPLTEAEHQ